MSPSILVTGITGFIGGCLARCLLSAGWSVSGIVRTSSRIDALPEEIQNAVRLYNADQMDLRAIVEAAAPDVVIHLATCYISAHSYEEIEKLVESNILFGTKLLDAMMQHNVKKMVYARSSWQHFTDDSYEAVNLYAATKQAFDTIVEYYMAAHGLQTISLTLFDTYGTDDHRNKLLAILPACTERGKPLALSPGEQEVDFVHGADAARAFALAAQYLLEDRMDLCGSYVVSSGKTVTLRELVRRYEKLIGKKLLIDWGARPYREREVMHPWRGGKILPGWVREHQELM